jgi:hypothetical protein
MKQQAGAGEKHMLPMITPLRNVMSNARDNDAGRS